MVKFIIVLSIILTLLGCTTLKITPEENKKDIYAIACSDKAKKGKSHWNISQLYNCGKKELFIPYQLWTGEKWDGNKNSSCMHEANTSFSVNGVSGTTIKGPVKWKNPETEKVETVWKREKMNGSKQQYFTCNEKGIGRVYDSRRGGRYFDSGRCKFPAGYGWEVGKQRKCRNTAIEITKIELDLKKNLSAIEFKWWYENRYGEYIHDHTYRYEPNIGSVNAWKQ